MFGPSAQAARQHAADLFAAAARHPDINPTHSIECLLAEAALGVVGRPIGVEEICLAPWDALITTALKTLGRLPEADFDDPDIITATRHAHRALWAWQ